MTMAALAGTPAYRLAAPALAPVNSFVRPTADLQEAALAGAVLMDAARFVFGGREVANLVRDTLPAIQGERNAQSFCQEVHRREQ